MTDQHRKKGKNVVRPKGIRAGIVAKPIISIKPLWLLLLKFVPIVCPHCFCTDLTPVEQLKDHLQEDVILQPRTQVTNFRHHQAFCPKCRRTVIQAAKAELLNCHIGPTTKAAAVFLRYGLNIP